MALAYPTGGTTLVFDVETYRLMSQQIAKYAREDFQGLIGKIPSKTDGFPDPYTPLYRKNLIQGSTGIKGGEPSPNQEKMQTSTNYAEYNLQTVHATMGFTPKDKTYRGKQLVEEKADQMQLFAHDMGLSVMKGVYENGYSSGVGQGSQLNEGILDQATTVENLNGTDSALDAAGDVFAALSNFIQTIPFKYLQKGAKVTLGMDTTFFNNANSDTFANESGETEMERFLRKYTSPSSPYKVDPNIIYSDELFLVSGDTSGTHSRLFAAVLDPAYVEKAMSKGPGPRAAGVTDVAGNYTEIYDCHLAGCVHNADCVLLSEQITW